MGREGSSGERTGGWERIDFKASNAAICSGDQAVAGMRESFLNGMRSVVKRWENGTKRSRKLQKPRKISMLFPVVGRWKFWRQATLAGSM